MFKLIMLSVFTLFLGVAGIASGCFATRSTTYNLLARVGVNHPQEFDFVIGVDLITDSGGDENKVVHNLLFAELSKRNYCRDGYVLTSRDFSQGGGYLLFRGYCLGVANR